MTTLDQYGISAGPQVREPARNDHGEVVCPVDGAHIEESRGVLELPTALVVDPQIHSALQDAGVEHLRSHGWSCEHCQVLVPSTTTGPEANGFTEGWVGVPVEYDRAQNRWVPVRKADVDAVPDGILADVGGGDR